MLLWLPLAACLLGPVLGIAYAAWRGLELWRGARRTMKVLGAGGGRVTDGLAELSRSSARLAEAPGRVGEAAAELQRTVALASAVAAAAAEARAGAEPVTALLRRRGRGRGRRASGAAA